MGYFKDQSIPANGPDVIHDKECPSYCPYPDMEYIAPGASLPKCRGGDCTLCDELECTCNVAKVLLPK